MSQGDAVSVVSATARDMTRFGVTARQGKALWKAAVAKRASDSEFAALDAIVSELKGGEATPPPPGLPLDQVIEQEPTEQLLLQVGLRGLARVFTLKREAITGN